MKEAFFRLKAMFSLALFLHTNKGIFSPKPTPIDTICKITWTMSITRSVPTLVYSIAGQLRSDAAFV